MSIRSVFPAAVITLCLFAGHTGCRPRLQPEQPTGEESFLRQQAALVASLTEPNTRQALRDLEQFAETHPGSKYLGAALALISECHATLGQPEQRLAAELKALAVTETDPSPAYWRIATIAEFEAGDLATARQYYRRLITEHPADIRKFAAQQALKRIGSEPSEPTIPATHPQQPASLKPAPPPLPTGPVTLRLAHQRLEAGVREGFDELIAGYQRLHPGARIIQEAIPDSVYGQWVTTQLMGGMAPDILEVGVGLPYHVWLSHFRRHCVPLDPWVDRPNPHSENAAPWRETFKDAMRAGYSDELQQYMSAPLSQFGVRVFYNRDLMRKLTGLEDAPQDYRAFLAACRAIAAQKTPRGDFYVPIAASRYHFQMWDAAMFDILTYPALRQLDLNRDAFVGADETYVGFATGRISFEFPAFRAKFRMLREVTRYFPPGFTGLSRDDAVFLFAQQRAVFISTGTWDARSLQQQAQGRFSIGLMDFPMPATNDVEYGQFIEGPRYERPETGFCLAISRNCRHPEVAADFLQYISARRQNERFNQIAGWIPSVTGAAVDRLAAEFQPSLEGVYGVLNLSLGGETWIKWRQLYALFQAGKITYEQLAAEFEPFYKQRGLAELRAQQPEPASAAPRVLGRQLRAQIHRARLLRLLEEGKAP
jgi:raffinose/stachyose/melibiose transport system substrate-binding protein